jgi:hypothetical protein
VTLQDQFLTALTAWRENRQYGRVGLQSIINVIVNRAAKTGDSPYYVCTQHEQFSSISVPGPEDVLWAQEVDPLWVEALNLTAQAAAGSLQDITGGSTDYYAPHSIITSAKFTLPNGTVVPFPRGWNPAAVKYQATIGSQLFFTEES